MYNLDKFWKKPYTAGFVWIAIGVIVCVTMNRIFYIGAAIIAIGFIVLRSIAKTRKKRKNLIERAEQGDVEEQYNIGMFLLLKRAPEDAKVWFVKAADQGHLGAEAELGDPQAQYEYALTFQDPSIKRDWLEKALAQGYVKAEPQLKEANRQIADSIAQKEAEDQDRLAKKRAEQEAKQKAKAERERQKKYEWTDEGGCQTRTSPDKKCPKCGGEITEIRSMHGTDFSCYSCKWKTW